MNHLQQLADKVKALTVFMIENRGKCFQEIDAARLYRYVAFHLIHGSVFTHCDKNGKVQMVVIAWREQAEEILRRRAAQAPQFDWQMPRADGDAILIDAVIGNRKWMPQIISQVTEHWPDSPRLRLFTHRGANPLREIKWNTITRFTYEQPQHT